MKKIISGFALLTVCLFAGCNLFFSGNAGEEGSVTLSLGGGLSAGAADDGVSFTLPLLEGEDGGVRFPDLGDSRIVVYNSAGKILRDYTFTQDQGSLKFSIPAGGPYWVDFSAPVIHPDDPKEDPFPFVKSFGATVKLDTVEKGASRELFLPLRVRETAIMVPYKMGLSNAQGSMTVQTNVFAPFFELPSGNYPDIPQSINRGIDEISFEFDPYGRVFMMMKKIFNPQKGVFRVDNFSDLLVQVNQISSAGDSGLAFNLRNGHLYYAYKTDGGDGSIFIMVYDVSGEEPNTNAPIIQMDLSSTIITIDEEGKLYGIVGDHVDNRAISVRPIDSYYTETADNGGVSSFNILDIFNFPPDKNISDWNIFDLKAQNGYLYALLFVRFDSESGEEYYDYFAAIPIESIKQGNVQGAWYAGGQSVDELDEGHDRTSKSLEGFFGPQKFAGWGPERVYVYDYNGDGDRFHRIVEVDLLNRKISKAGLIATIKEF